MLAFKPYTGCLREHPEAGGMVAWALPGGAWTVTYDQPDHQHLLLWDADDLVGILKYQPPTGGRVHVLYILIRKDRHGGRLAGRLLDAFLEQVRAAFPGVVVECEIVSGMRAAVEKLLTSRGFTRDGDEWTKKL